MLSPLKPLLWLTRSTSSKRRWLARYWSPTYRRITVNSAPLTSPDNRSRLKRHGTDLQFLCSEKLSCFLIATSPVEVKIVPSTEKGGGCGKVKDGRCGRSRVAPRCGSKRHARTWQPRGDVCSRLRTLDTARMPARKPR